MIRLLQQAAGNYTLTASTIDPDTGALIPVTSSTLEVFDGAGVSVFTGMCSNGADFVTCDVPVASLPLLDTYSTVWTCTTTGADVVLHDEVELVGGHLFTLVQLRAADSSAFADFTDPQLAQVRIEVEETIEGEDAAKVAFVPRGRRATLNGSGMRTLIVPDLETSAVHSVVVDGTPWAPEKVATLIVHDDRLVLPVGQTWTKGIQNVTVHYTHGRTRLLAPIRRAGVLLAKEYLSTADISGRATAMSVGDQMFRITIAGRDGVTGLPEVDAAINQHGRKYRSR